MLVLTILESIQIMCILVVILTSKNYYTINDNDESVDLLDTPRIILLIISGLMPYFGFWMIALIAGFIHIDSIKKGE